MGEGKRAVSGGYPPASLSLGTPLGKGGKAEAGGRSFCETGGVYLKRIVVPGMIPRLLAV
jgi:hypothetical protein